MMRKTPLRISVLVFCSLFAAVLLLSSQPVAAAKGSIQWYTNFDQAQQLARDSKKPMFVMFTGSDWCRWCKMLKQEVLDTPEFADKMSDKFVFVELDFPRQSSLPPQTVQQHEALKRKYGVDGFPTVVILDAQGKKLGTVGYRKGGGAAYADYVNSLV